MFVSLLMIDVNGIAKMFEKFAKQLATARDVPSGSSGISGRGAGALSNVPNVVRIRFTGPGLCIVSPDGRVACARIDGRMSIHELANMLKNHVPEGTMYCLFIPSSPNPFRCAPSLEQLLSGQY